MLRIDIRVTHERRNDWGGAATHCGMNARGAESCAGDTNASHDPFGMECIDGEAAEANAAISTTGHYSTGHGTSSQGRGIFTPLERDT